MSDPENTIAKAPDSQPLRTGPGFTRMASLAVSLLAAAYLGGIILVTLGMEFAGERIWPFALMLYLPQQVLLLPLLVLLPAALLAEVPRWCWGLIGAALIIFLWHVPFHLHGKGPETAHSLKVMTNNYGQNHGLSLEPWIAAENPDIVALEDMPAQGRTFQWAHPDWSVKAAGQFVLMSKTPIRSATLLLTPAWRGWPVAAVFDVPWQGKDLAVYTIHMPTPRPDFAKLAGLGLLREIVGRNRRRSDGWSFAEAMTARVALARQLAAVLAAEKRPYVAVGDFNMPADGYVHRIFARQMTDAFATAGFGFGFTFPGDARNPLAFFRPWIRLDYVFAGPGWQVDDCQVEPRRRSEHRAVVAVLDPS